MEHLKIPDAGRIDPLRIGALKESARRDAAATARRAISEAAKVGVSELWRGTGRSQQMLERAALGVSRGELVAIVLRRADLREFSDRITSILMGMRLPVTDLEGRITWLPVERSFLPMGVRASVVFVDHRAWEELPADTARLVTRLHDMIPHVR